MFSEVLGMTELNGRAPLRVKNCRAHSFSLEVDSTGFRCGGRRLAGVMRWRWGTAHTPRSAERACRAHTPRTHPSRLPPRPARPPARAARTCGAAS